MVMKRVIVGFVLVLALGTTTVAYAKERQGYGYGYNRRNVESNFCNRPNGNSMLALMEQYGYGELAQDIKNRDYAAMDNYMDNLSDEDYQKMIDIMKENGCENIVDRLERFTKDRVIPMQKPMGGWARCYR